jgi:plastocyanin
MTVFGPAAFASWLWLSRTLPERSGARWIAEQAARLGRAAAGRRPSVGFALPAGGLAALVLAVALWSGETAVSAPSASASASSEATTLKSAVVMKNVAFTPRAAKVKVGDTVTWINHDRVPHDVVATAGASFDSGTFGQGETFEFRPSRPGTIAYVCTLHQGMDATLTVTR